MFPLPKISVFDEYESTAIAPAAPAAVKEAMKSPLSKPQTVSA